MSEAGDTSLKHQLLQRHIADIDTIVVESETQSLLLENNLIKEYQPRFNVRLKDDKSFPYLAITSSEVWPRARVMRALRGTRIGASSRCTATSCSE